ncbi:hypothetical protein J4221_04270 [Candidatus Pacearchaeota archaeon]|nr:hypothetical protein [Candidatus Pacearchaeota archaeon]
MAIPILFVSPFFVEYILPFVLVFTIVFAVLQKTQLFGEDKRAIDTLIGLVIGLILIGFPYARSLIILLMPFLAFFVVLLLVFMLLYGFASGKKDSEGGILSSGWKIAWIAFISLSLITYLLIISGYWDFVLSLFFGTRSGPILSTIIMIVAIIAVIVAVIKGEKKSS